MGAIQSSINQALSVGALLASQSETLRARVSRHQTKKELEAQEQTYQQAQSLRTSEKRSLTRLQKKSTAQEEKLKGALSSEKLKEAYPELNIDTEGIRKELSEKFEKDVKKTGEKEIAAAEHEAIIAQQGVDISSKKYELDPSQENLKQLIAAKDKLSSAQRTQKQATQRTAQNLNRLEQLEFYRSRANAELEARRQEMGDKMFIGGVEFTAEHPLYQRVQEQLQKEEQ